MNKVDLLEGGVPPEPDYPSVAVSAKYRLGIETLLESMRNTFPGEQPLVFLDRHALLLRSAHGSLENCLHALEAGLTPDVLTIDLKHAIGYLGQMTGKTVDEDVLEMIFSRFCIGK
jgi:tRNA modification GTPase